MSRIADKNVTCHDRNVTCLDKNVTCHDRNVTCLDKNVTRRDKNVRSLWITSVEFPPQWHNPPPCLPLTREVACVARRRERKAVARLFNNTDEQCSPLHWIFSHSEPMRKIFPAVCTNLSYTIHIV